MTGPVRIELLGPLVVRLGAEQVEPGPLRLQALLAALTLRADKGWSAEDLFDAVWGDRPPTSGLKVLPPYVYRLRRAQPVEIDRTREGYVLRLAGGSLDVDDFDASVRDAASYKARGEYDAAAASYNAALNLFRGDPLSGLPGQYLAAQRTRLIEQRYKVLSDRIELDLESGRHLDVVAELVTAVAERPLDERLAGQLMLALYAAGRQAEALDTYRQTRDTLVDQLGVEPGPELRATHQRILRNETATVIAVPGRNELPYQDATFVGRDAELATVVAALRPADHTAPPVVTIDGMGGAGKTALAIRAAREVTADYPDGLLYLQLHGHTPDRQPLGIGNAFDHLLGSIGVKPEPMPQDFDEQGRSLAFRSRRTTVPGRAGRRARQRPGHPIVACSPYLCSADHQPPSAHRDRHQPSSRARRTGRHRRGELAHRDHRGQRWNECRGAGRPLRAPAPRPADRRGSAQAPAGLDS